MDAGYSFQQFKNGTGGGPGSAHFGRASVHRGNKAFDLGNNAHSIEADVAPFFEYRQYWQDKTFQAGVALIPVRGGRIDNFPERLVEHWPATPLHYEQGFERTTRPRDATRAWSGIMKKLRNLMDERAVAGGRADPWVLDRVPGVERPRSVLRREYLDARVQAVLTYLTRTRPHQRPAKSGVR